jgi:D-3-phosphoglycerate dehydrogenase / 2-oxoglutarate reductase
VTAPLRILAAGDAYVTADAFRRGLGDRLDPRHALEVFEVDASRTAAGRTPSERRLREYSGSPDELVERLSGHDVLVVHGAAVSDAVLDRPGLRLVCCARGGPVNVDSGAAAARGIPVTTTPGKNANAVVELTIAFLIMLARGIRRSQDFLLQGGRLGQSAFEGAEFFGLEVSGRMLGLVGYGQVGRRVARAATALGMRVCAYDPVIATGAFDAGVEAVSLEALLAMSEFVSLHARASSENENMIGAAELAAMRPGAFFINTARESLVDDDALHAALASGHLGGAALDVVRPAPGGTHPLLTLQNVVLTPHIGGATAETIDRGIGMIAAEIERFSNGDPLRNAL